VTVLAIVALMLALAPSAFAADRVAEVSIHGNTLTSDEEIVRLAGVSAGMPFDDRTVEEVAERLRASKRFEHVEVLKRYASIADPSQILLVIVVDEGPVRIRQDGTGAASVSRSRRVALMFLPLLEYEDGYGMSYGLRVTAPGALGRTTRVSFPVTWGGDKRGAVEFEARLDGTRAAPVVTRLQVAAQLSRREHPFFRENEDRREVRARVERQVGRVLRLGASAARDHVTFAGADDRLSRVGADAIVDTRIEPMLARNAVYARAAWEHVAFEDRPSAERTSLEGRAYAGLPGHSVLVLRALRDDANRAVPPYLMPMIGGAANLRGFRAGTAVGDTLFGASVELRVPLTSPLSVGRIGVSSFVDAATVYAKGERLRDQTLRRGIGAGVWFSATVFRLSVDVAHGVGGATRVHVTSSLTF
jgi:outer membrane protein assembly factor BamA